MHVVITSHLHSKSNVCRRACLCLPTAVVEKEVRRTVNGSISVLTEKVSGVAQTLAGQGASPTAAAGTVPSAEEGVPPEAGPESAAAVENAENGTRRCLYVSFAKSVPTATLLPDPFVCPNECPVFGQ